MKKATCATSETILGHGDRLGFETLQIRDVMQCGVWSIEGNEPVHKAIQLLLDKHISGLPVPEPCPPCTNSPGRTRTDKNCPPCAVGGA